MSNSKRPKRNIEPLDRPVRRIAQWSESYSGRSGDAASGRVDVQPPPGLFPEERIAWRVAHAEFDSHAEFAEDAEFAGIARSPSGPLGGASPLGEPLSPPRTSFSPVSTNFYAYDTCGQVINVAFDVSSDAYAYDSIGNRLSSSGPMADFFPHRFSTKYLDPDLGLYYYGHRWYSPGLGRWISRDPIEEEGGGNLFSFVCNAAGGIPTETALRNYPLDPGTSDY